MPAALTTCQLQLTIEILKRLIYFSSLLISSTSFSIESLLVTSDCILELEGDIVGLRNYVAFLSWMIMRIMFSGILDSMFSARGNVDYIITIIPR